MTAVRLALGNGPPLALRKGLGAVESRFDPPALLVSWWYWKPFEKERHQYVFRDYSLDCGAFSAHHSGARLDLDEYIEFCQRTLATDPQCAEVFALDVMADWRAGLRNVERMWECGVPAIPAYHVGEPGHVLDHLAKTYPKVALGGAVGMKGPRKLAWAQACFRRVWPKPVHGFGFGSERAVMTLPFHSVDATNWEAGPARFGQWKSMPGGSIRGKDHPLRMEVEWYLRVEERARFRWRREMSTLATMLGSDGPAPNVRMAVALQGNQQRMLNAFGRREGDRVPDS